MTDIDEALGEPGDDEPDRTLDGCVVVVTREQRGELGRLLAERGARVEHVPLIGVIDPDPGDADDLAAALAEGPGWVVVTSAAGAERVGDAVRADPGIRTAVVGTATARRLAELSGRPVDVVPRRQLSASLAEALVAGWTEPQHVVVAQGDLASDELAAALHEAGHHVVAVTAYRTVLRTPTEDEVQVIRDADAVLFASGSAAEAWRDALGDEAADLLPPIVAAIGPTTEEVAERRGLKVTCTAADHSLTGLVAAVESVWRTRRR